MDYRRLGNSDLQVSAVCMGTMTFGQQNSESQAHAQLNYAFDQGVNFIDAAEMYPVPPRAETYGRTESIVGTWLRTRPRDRVILATKVAGPARGMPWIRGGPKSLDRDNIRAALEHSLQRLQTDYIDLYQLHWPERNTPMFGQYQFNPANEPAEDQAAVVTSLHAQLETLTELVREGKLRYIGVSNEHPWGVMEFLRLAQVYDLSHVVSIQNSYNMINRVFDSSLAEVAYREQVGLLAYSPLAFGHLSGKYLAAAPPADGRITLFPSFGQRYNKPNVVPAVTAYARIAHQHGLSLAQLALAFAYRRACVTSTIIGATTPEQLVENLGAWNLQLPENVLAEIETVHLQFTNPAP